MKYGYYIRFVPSLNEYCFYVYAGEKYFSCCCGHIFDASSVDWRVPLHSKPYKDLGFEYVCDLEGRDHARH